MDRYTKMSDGYYVVSSNVCYEDQDENYCGEAIDHLAQYEDTGLTPAECAELAQAKRDGRVAEVVRCGECRHAINCSKISVRCKIYRVKRHKIFDYCSYGQLREAAENALKEREA